MAPGSVARTLDAGEWGHGRGWERACGLSSVGTMPTCWSLLSGIGKEWGQGNGFPDAFFLFKKYLIITKR